VNRRCFLVFIIISLTMPVFADDVSGLFDDPQGGIIEDESGTRVDVDALTTSKAPKITGTVLLEGGLAYGLKDWPDITGSSDIDWAGLLDGTVGYILSSGLNIDVRPKSHIRFFASLSTALNTTTYDFSTISIGQLFVDYTLLNTWFLRIGKQSLEWGQGRLLGNPGNVVASVSDGVAVKTFVPLGSNGLTAVIYANDAIMTTTSSPSEFGYAGLFETSIGDAVVGVSGHWQKKSDLATVVYLKGSLLSVDSVVETRVNWDLVPTDPSSPEDPQVQTLLNLFWEGGSPKWTVLGEYLFDSTVSNWMGHSAGIAIARASFPVTGWKTGINWNHAFADASGQVLVGFEGPLVADLRIAFAMPIIYGESGSYWRIHNPDDAGRVVSAAVKITLKIKY